LEFFPAEQKISCWLFGGHCVTAKIVDKKFSTMNARQLQTKACKRAHSECRNLKLQLYTHETLTYIVTYSATSEQTTREAHSLVTFETHSIFCHILIAVGAHRSVLCMNPVCNEHSATKATCITCK